MNREQAEPLTIAYIGIGVIEAITADKDGYRTQKLADKFGGQLGVVEEVIQHAKLLDALADVATEAMEGCFAYEVAEEFGKEYTNQLLEGQEPSAYAIAFDLMKNITE